MAVGVDSERAIWAEIEQYPLDSRTERLVLVRHAQKLTDKSRIVQWLSERNVNPLTFEVFVSDEDKIAKEAVTVEGKTSQVMVPHLAAINSKGSVIECKPFTNATAKYAVEWVQSKVEMRKDVAGNLLNRANGDLRLVRDLCTKLSAFNSNVSTAVVNNMLSEKPRDTFSDALLAMDKKGALLALDSIPQTEYSKIIGLLDSNIELVGQVHDMQLDRKTNAEITRAMGNRGFLLKDILGITKHYDAKRRLEIRKTLAIADEAIQGGYYTGTLELVTLLW